LTNSAGVRDFAAPVISNDDAALDDPVPARKFAVIVLTNKSGETMRKSLGKATELVLGLKDDEPENPHRSRRYTARREFISHKEAQKGAQMLLHLCASLWLRPQARA